MREVVGVEERQRGGGVEVQALQAGHSGAGRGGAADAHKRTIDTWLRRTASNLTGDGELVKDLVQEGRVALWLHLPKKGLPSSFQMATVRRVMIRYMQDKARIIRLPRWLHDERRWEEFPNAMLYGDQPSPSNGDERDEDKDGEMASPSFEDGVLQMVIAREVVVTATAHSPKQAAVVGKSLTQAPLTKNEYQNRTAFRKKARREFTRLGVTIG